jgi:HEAT repeat protein
LKVFEGYAVKALDNIEDAKAVEPLIRTLEGEDESIRRLAA